MNTLTSFNNIHPQDPVKKHISMTKELSKTLVNINVLDNGQDSATKQSPFYNTGKDFGSLTVKSRFSKATSNTKKSKKMQPRI